MGETTVEDLGPVFRLLYRSRLSITPGRRDAELDAIFGVARLKNAVIGITGALLVWQDAFVQLIEGDESTVRALYATIRVDPRHEHVTLLDADTVPDRVFARWSMAHVSDADGTDLPVVTDLDAADTTPPPDHPDQRTMLGLMREYARMSVEPR